mgnify:CR=1 FL=1
MNTVFVKLIFHKGFFVNHSFKIIFIKYNFVIEYMKNTYNIDLTKYAEILNQ